LLWAAVAAVVSKITNQAEMAVQVVAVVLWVPTQSQAVLEHRDKATTAVQEMATTTLVVAVELVALVATVRTQTALEMAASAHLHTTLGALQLELASSMLQTACTIWLAVAVAVLIIRQETISVAFAVWVVVVRAVVSHMAAQLDYQTLAAAVVARAVAAQDSTVGQAL
jgi:hypothetical protein